MVTEHILVGFSHLFLIVLSSSSFLETLILTLHGRTSWLGKTKVTSPTGHLFLFS